VIELAWSRLGNDDCLRARGLAPSTVDLEVFPAAVLHAKRAVALPPMAGRTVVDGDDVCFVPRFAFVPGTAYRARVGGHDVGAAVRPEVAADRSTEVVAIHPSVPVVPRNLLRLYVQFSAPMAEGDAAEHVALVDEEGAPMVASLLRMDEELWDASRQRLTVLLDPARIKRGLVSHAAAGYPLRRGAAFRVVVDEGFRDARGVALRAGAERRYLVGDDERRRVDPAAWQITPPAVATQAPVRVVFDRPLDHGLATRCLRVVDADGRRVAGAVRLAPDARSWELEPTQTWRAGRHAVEVDATLEDLAGNSVARVFDRALADADDDRRRPGDRALPFLL